MHWRLLKFHVKMPGIMLLTVAGRAGLGMRCVFLDEEAAALEDEGMAVGPRLG
jgi:hypothetical protein